MHAGSSSQAYVLWNFGQIFSLLFSFLTNTQLLVIWLGSLWKNVQLLGFLGNWGSSRLHSWSIPFHYYLPDVTCDFAVYSDDATLYSVFVATVRVNLKSAGKTQLVLLYCSDYSGL